MTIQLIIDSKFNSQGVQQAERQLRQMVTGLDDLFAKANQSVSSGLATDNFISQFRGEDLTPKVEQAVGALDRYTNSLRQAAAAALANGDAQKSLDLISVANQVDSTANSFRSLIQEEEQQSGVLDFINNKFNKFAFGLFVVQGAISTVTRLVGQLTDFMLEGASVADRANAFNVLLEDAGINATALASSLREASQGALTLDAAMRPTLQLMKANVPDVAGMSDELLKIATASAVLSGDLKQTENIYTTLVRGIVRGSPRLIDNADIYLKLGDAVESYAERAGKSIEELTPEDRISATAEAVRDQGQAIVELAEQVDSSALVIQSFKTDIENAWNSIKAAIGSGSADTIAALDDFADVLDPVIVKLGKLVTGSEEAGIALEKIIDAAPFATFVQTIITSFDLLGAYIRGYGAELTEIWNAVVSVFVTGSTLIAEGFQMISSGDYEGGIARINEQFAVFKDRLVAAADPHNQINEQLELARERARQTGEELGLYGDKIQNNVIPPLDAAAAAQQRLANSFDGLSAGIQDAIEARTGPAAQFAERRADIEESLADKITDINEDLADKLSDITSGLQEKLVDLGAKYKEDVTKLAQETSDELREIDEGLADKLNDISEKSGKSREDAQKDRNKGIQDAHEDHQKKLLEIERRYEASRLKALIDRDARALFEAEQSRKQGQEEANDDLEERIKDEEEQLKEKMEEINDLEEERRKDAIEAAEKRRKDAIEAQAKELQDLKDSFAKQKQEAAKSANEQRQEAIKSANERRRDAQENYRDSLQDLDEWYQEQLTLQKERQLQQKISELEHLEEMGELTQAHLDELRGMWNDYNSFVSGASGGSANVPNGGGGGSIGGGSSGSVPSGGGGQIGGIVGGRQEQTSQFNQQRMQLSINSNDKTLEDVLRSSTYDFMLEALDE